MTNEDILCPLCSATTFTRYARLEKAELVRCTSCRLIRLLPFPASKVLKRKYSEEYFEHIGYQLNDQKAFQQLQFEGRQRVDLIVPYIRQASLLDVGCAAGFFLDAARSKGFKVRGVEPSDQMSSYARNRLHLDVLTGTLEEACIEPERFDVVTLWHVIEHLAQPLGLLREVSRILKPGGLLFIEAPNISHARYLARRNTWLDVVCYPQHLLHFTMHTLTRLTEAGGFVVVDLQPRSRSFYEQRPERWKRLVDWGLERVGLPGLIGLVAQKK